MKSKMFWIALFTFLFLFQVRSAAAQEGSPRTADEKFDAGVQLLKQGNYAEARAAFLSIAQHERTSAVHCNIGFVEYKLSHSGESVEALERCFDSTVYIPSLPGDQQQRWKALLAKQQALVGRFSVITNVASATVEVDGRMRAETPFKNLLPITAGVHRVRVAAAGYVPIVTQVTVKAFDKQTIAFELVRTAKLAIFTKLPRSEVIVDDAVVGTTPLPAPLELAPGDHTIQVRRDGYTTFHAEKKLDAGVEHTLSVRMVEDPSWIGARGGTLAITLVEDDVVLWVDGEPRNLTKPSLRLAPGVHHIVVRKHGFEPMEREVEIDGGAITTIVLRLVPTLSTVNEAKIKFDRRRHWGIGISAGGAALTLAGAGVLGYFTEQAERPVYHKALCDSDNYAANRTPCPTYRQGQVLGGVGVGLGAVLIATGAWLFWGNDASLFDLASRERDLARLPVLPIVNVTPGRPEASVGLLGRF